MMTITLPADLEKKVLEQAAQRGTSPENIVLDILREAYLPRSPEPAKAVEPCDEEETRRRLSKIKELLKPRDEWEERLLRIGTPCGVVPSAEAMSSEGLYE